MWKKNNITYLPEDIEMQSYSKKSNIRIIHLTDKYHERRGNKKNIIIPCASAIAILFIAVVYFII